MLPHASGVAMARVAKITGAFHGAMPSTTPAGWRIASESAPGLSEGITCPSIWVVRAAASRSMLLARCTLKPAQGAVAPSSSIISSVKSAALLCMTSAAFSSTARRAPGPDAAQAGKAAAAPSAARCASARVAAAARVAGPPVIGLMRSKVAPSLAAALSPLISRLMFVIVFPLLSRSYAIGEDALSASGVLVRRRFGGACETG